MKTADFLGFSKANGPYFFTWVSMALCLLTLTGCPALDARRAQSSPSSTESRAVAAPRLYGNVYGTITDYRNKAPISGAKIYLADLTVRRYPSEIAGAVPSDNGWIIIPSTRNAVRNGRSKSDGTFIVNRIPTADPPKTYTIIIVAPDRDTLLIENATIYPGASQSLHIHCRIPDDGKAHVASTDEASPYVTSTYAPGKK